MSNVVTMPGLNDPAVPGEPVVEVVAVLEHYLERAQRGEVTAVGIATVISDGTPIPYTSTAFKRASGTVYILESAINRLKRTFDDYLDEE